jgi:hypothetical protein
VHRHHVVDAAAGVVSRAAEGWIASLADLRPPDAAVAAGGGPAWAAALELALMLARVPAEGAETREGHDVDRPGWMEAYYATARGPA